MSEMNNPLKLYQNCGDIQNKINSIKSILKRDYSLDKLTYIYKSANDCSVLVKDLIELLPGKNFYHILTFLSIRIYDISTLYKKLNFYELDEIITNLLLFAIFHKCKDKIDEDNVDGIFNAYKKEFKNNCISNTTAFLKIYHSFKSHIIYYSLESEYNFNFIKDKQFIKLITILKKELGASLKDQVNIVIDIFNGININDLNDEYSFQFIPKNNKTDKIKYISELQKLVFKYSDNRERFNILKLLCAIYMYKISNKNSSYEVVSPKENDFMIESTIAYNMFVRSVIVNENNKENPSVVIGASPFFIYKWCCDSLVNKQKIIFVLSAKEVEFYKSYFSNGSYVSKTNKGIQFLKYEDYLNLLKNKNIFNNVLYLQNGDISFYFLDIFYYINENQYVFVLDHDKVVDTILENKIFCNSLDSVFVLPRGIKNSGESKKKVFLMCKLSNDKSFKFYSHSISKGENCQYISLKKHYLSYPDQYFKDGVSLRKLISYRENNIITRNIRCPAKSIRFSDEIVIWYSFKTTNHKTRVEMYLKDTIFSDSEDKGNMITDSKIIKMISSEDKINEYVKKNYLFSVVKKGKNPRRIRDVISRIFNEKFDFNNSIINFSLRTAWIINEKSEEGLSLEQNGLLKKVMLSPVGELRINNLQFESFEDILSDDNYDFTDKIEECYSVISVVLDYLVKISWITKNVIDEKFRYDNLEQRHFNKLKGIITKKTLTDKEYTSLINTITKRIEKRNFSYIGSLIGILTGLENNIICGLCWEDFIEDEMGYFHLQIYRQVSHDGKTYSKFKSVDSYRLFPVTSFLKSYLIEKYNYDFLLYGNDFLKHRIVDTESKNINPTSLARMNKKLFSDLEIDKELIYIPNDKKGLIETDINRYKGNIFKSDFIKRCIDANLSPDEISYLIGNKRITTISNYYLDFNDILVQHKLYVKLSRLTTPLINISDVKLESGVLNENDLKNIEISSDTQVQISLEVEAQNSDKGNIYIKTDYGFDIEVE